MNTGSPNLDALLLKLTNKKEREILEQYAGKGSRRADTGKWILLRTWSWIEVECLCRPARSLAMLVLVC